MRKVAISIAFMMSLTQISHAEAHSELLKSSPVARSTVAIWPSAISLTFGEKLMVLDGKAVNSISVKDSTGARLDRGTAKVVGPVISISTVKPSTPGKISVSYRVVSNDGHPISSQYFFIYKPKK